MALNGIKNLVLAALPPADFATFELPEAIWVSLVSSGVVRST